MMMVRVHFLDIVQEKFCPNLSVGVELLISRVKLKGVVFFNADVSVAFFTLYMYDLSHWIPLM